MREGLTRDQLTRRHPPSTLTLAGLLYHLSLAEEDWMEIHFLGQPDREPFLSADWEATPTGNSMPLPIPGRSSCAGVTATRAIAAGQSPASLPGWSSCP